MLWRAHGWSWAMCGAVLIGGCFEEPGGGASEAGSDSTATGTTTGSTAADPSTGSAGTGTDGGRVELVDDALDGEFGAGNFVDTQWVGDRIAIVGGLAAGAFESRVFDSGSAGTSWDRIAWTPAAPYGLPLPDGGAAESGYESGAIDMADNVLLLHMEGSGSIGAGATVLEHSGLAHTVQATVSGPSPAYVKGVLGTAFGDELGSHLAVASGPEHALEPGPDDFTWAIWVNGSQQCEGDNGGANQALMGVDNVGGSDITTHVWLGCYRSSDAVCETGPALSRAGGTVQSSLNRDDSIQFCGAVPIIDTTWHHLALVNAATSTSSSSSTSTATWRWSGAKHSSTT